MEKEKHPKRYVGIIKLASFLLFPTLALGSLGVALGTGIAAGTIGGNSLNDDYKKTAIYEEWYNADVDEANRAYEAGEIKHLEYNNRISYIGSNDYVLEIMNKDLEGNEEFQARFEKSEILKKACYVSLGLSVAGIAGTFVEMAKDPDKLYNNAIKDIRYTEYEKIDNFEVSEDEEEELPSIDESYYKS